MVIHEPWRSHSQLNKGIFFTPSDSTSFTLEIRGNAQVQELSVLSLSCFVLASPVPVLSWLKRSEGRVSNILNTTRISITNQYSGGNITSTLTIDRAAPSDTGVYICAGRNAVDSAVVERSVIVPGTCIQNYTTPKYYSNGRCPSDHKARTMLWLGLRV